MDPHLRELIEAGDPEEELELILKLRPDQPPPPDVRIIVRFGDIVTCRVPRRRTLATWASETVVSAKAPRLVWPEPVFGVEDAAPESWPASPRVRPEGATGKGTVVAAIDWGCDFAHPNFRNADGSTRLLGLWDQSKTTKAVAAGPYGYGAVYLREEIDRALQDHRPYAALGYHPGDSDPLDDGAHGTHVLDIAAGNGRLPGSALGMAPDADLVFVHLAARAIQGKVALGDTARILEALDFIATLAGDRPLVVNLSVGRCAGPHNGLTLVEQGIDQFLYIGSSHPASSRCVVHSTGNYFSTLGHAAGQIRPGESRTLTWCTDPADVTPNELEVWYPARDRFTVELEPPEGGSSLRVARGEHAPIERDGTEVGHLYHRESDPTNGDHHIDILLGRNAPPGNWRVTLVGEDVVDGRFHAWIERDAVCHSCQSRFTPEDVVQLSTTGTICNGFRSIAVGAYDPHQDGIVLSSFSSSGPTLDGRAKPNLVAPGVGIIAARSTPRTSDVPAPGVIAKSGTSMAAPHVTGTVACMFEAANRLLPIHETRAYLLGSASLEGTRAEDAARIGSGVLDSRAAVNAARGSFAPRVVVALAAVAADALPASETLMQSEVPMSALPEQIGAAEPESELDETAESCGLTEEAAEVSAIRARAPAPRLTRTSDWGREVIDVFDAVTRGANESVTARISEGFDIIARPGAMLESPLHPGDILLRRALGEGIAHAGYLASGEALSFSEAVSRGWRPERAVEGRYATVIESGPFGHARAESFARRLTDARGRLPADQLILRPRLPMEVDLSEAVFNVMRVPADRHPPDGYDRFQVRTDLADSYSAAYGEVHALGGVLTSSGGLRDLSTEVSAGRSGTSLHYTGRAIDLYIRSGMQSQQDPYLLVRDGGSDANPLWKVWCVSTNPPTGSDPALIQDRDLECAIWERHTGYRTVRRSARCFCLTDVLSRRGWSRIPARSSWRENYLSVEWWHFQNESGLIAGVTTFGDELRQIWPGDEVGASGLALGAVWTGTGSFRAGAGVSRGGPDRETIRWAQIVLNTVAGERLSTDGNLGPITREALRRFQIREQLPAGGALDTTTEIALVQRALEHLSQASMFGSIGVLDQRTIEEIRRYQATKSLPADGRIGAPLRAAIARDVVRPLALREQYAENIGDGSPFRARATASCWTRTQGFQRASASPGSPNVVSASRILAESGVRVDANPYFGLTQDKIDAVVRAGFNSRQMPAVLLALWTKEGSSRMVSTPRPVPAATTADRARTLFRCQVYYEDLGADHFMVTTRTAGQDNVWDPSDAAAPGHEAHFTVRVRDLVTAGFLSEDISGEVNGELNVTGGPPFSVRPSTRFYALSLLLVDAYFSQLQSTSFPELVSLSPELNYMHWNMGTRSFRTFLASADRHRREPAFVVGGQPIELERWALHTPPRMDEYGGARMNAIGFMHYLSSYQPIFAGSLNLIKPGIQDLIFPVTASRLGIPA